MVIKGFLKSTDFQIALPGKSLLLLLLLVFGGAGLYAQRDTSDAITAFPKSGSYLSGQRVVLSAEDDSVALQFSIDLSLDDSWNDYLFPIELSGLDGEERQYSIRVRAVKAGEVVDTRQFDYFIDRRIPARPVLSPPPGIYHGEVEIRLKALDADKIYVSTSPSFDEYRQIDGREKIVLKPSDYWQNLYCFAEDKAGNRSSVTEYEFLVLPGFADTAELEILSPRPGRYLNYQMLVLNTTHVEWIRYSFDDADPVTEGFEYFSPSVLNRTGTFRLNVAAKVLNDTQILTETVLLSVEETAISLDQGNRPDDRFSVSIPSDMFYRINDSASVNADSVQDVVLEGSEGIFNYWRIVYGESESDSLYSRFFYRDQRRVQSPQIHLFGDLPISAPEYVQILADPKADIFYTLDGTTPDLNSLRYIEPFLLELPEEGDSGSIILQAIAMYNGDLGSEVASSLVTWSRITPDQPQVRWSEMERQIKIEVQTDFYSFPVYEVSVDGTDPNLPGPISPYCDSEIILSAPVGTTLNYRIRFAAINAGGLMSEPSEVFSFTVDHQFPEKPRILFDRDILSLSGNDDIYYRIESLSDSGSQTGEFELYREPVSLSGQYPEGFRVYGKSRDDSGLWSLETEELTVDRRAVIPDFPDITGFPDTGITNAESLNLACPGLDPGVTLYYQVVRGSESSGNMSEESFIPFISGNHFIDISDFADGEIDFIFRPRFNDSKHWGESRQYRVVIDRTPPEPAVLVQPGGATVFNVDYYLEIEQFDISDLVTLRIDSSNDDIPYSEFRYLHPVKLSGIDGREVVYSVEVVTSDRVGNLSDRSMEYSVIIDRSPPVLPSWVEELEDVVVNSDYTLEYHDSDVILIYEISDNHSVPEIPGRLSRRFYDDIPFYKTSNKDRFSSILLRAMDGAGNLSEEVKVVNIYIDCSKPDYPSPLQFYFDSTTRLLTVLSPSVDDDTLFFGLREGDYFPFEGEYSWVVPPSQSEVEVFYYLEDSAGNRSHVADQSFQLPFTPYTLVQGGYNGEVRRESFQISSVDDAFFLRYELSRDGRPSTVTSFSPRLTGPLEISGVEGNLEEYVLTVKLFSDESDLKGSLSQTLRLILDSQAPPVPEILSRDILYYKEGNPLVLNSEEGDVFFSLETGNGADQDFQLYQQPVLLEFDNRFPSSFIIHAYTRDQAGNRSPTVSWPVYIDDMIIYVDNRLGDDRSAGRRNTPLRTLRQAIETARIDNKTIIWLAEGDYTLSKSVVLNNRSLKIAGGFSSSSWIKADTGTTSSITVDDELDSDLFQQNAGVLRLESLNIHLGQAGLYQGRNGELALTDIAVSSAELNGSLISKHGGSALITGSNFEMMQVNCDEVVVFSDLEFGISDSSFITQRNSRRTSLLKIANESNGSLNDIQVLSGVGTDVTLVEVRDSELSLNLVFLDSGKNSGSATVITSYNSRVVSVDLSARIASGTRLGTGILAQNSRLSFSDSIWSCFAAVGNLGVKLTDTQWEDQGSRFDLDQAEEFNYWAVLKRSTAELSFSEIQVADSGSTIILQSDSGRSVIRDSLFEMSESTLLNVGVYLRGNAGIDFYNNAFHFSGDANKGSWLIAQKPLTSGDRVYNNLFDGWSVLLMAGENSIQSINQLNSLDGDDIAGPIYNNRIP